MAGLKELKVKLNKLADKTQAKILQGFFKTSPGQYGEGDIFLGIKVPLQRQVAKGYPDLRLSEIQQLLNSQIHEHRLIALFILINQYQKSNLVQKEKIFKFYLKNSKRVNNWDLVDLSAPNIIGDYLLNHNRGILYRLAKSNNIWERRIAILATYRFIKNNDFADTLKVAELLLNDTHDLIHKAVGWMLRELGKKNQTLEEKFLKKYAVQMPRTMLRYAVEKFSPSRRQYYLKMK